MNHEHDFVFQTLFAPDLTPIHCQMITVMLKCRIGVFVGDKLTKYGDWEWDDGTVTLLFDFDGGYNVVTGLIN